MDFRQFNSHPAAHAIGMALRHKPAAPKPEEKPVLDGAGCEDKPNTDENQKPGDEPAMDAVGESYVATDIAVQAAAAVQEWAETSADDLDEGENLSTRLQMLLVGIADADMDGEISEDEAAIVELAFEAAGDYLGSKGVSDEDIDAILNDGDGDAAARAQELVAERLPEGDGSDDIDAFVFGSGDGSDEAALDAVYKMKTVIRGGKKTRMRKRVSGTVRLSAKQKVAVRKMLRKANSAGARMKRMKSQRIRRKMGL